jgi:hypothetical protein
MSNAPVLMNRTVVKVSECRRGAPIAHASYLYKATHIETVYFIIWLVVFYGVNLCQGLCIDLVEFAHHERWARFDARITTQIIEFSLKTRGIQITALLEIAMATHAAHQRAIDK